MARVKGTLPNFANGISQQPPSIRLPSQGEAQSNLYSTVAKGLVRRPATEHIAKISDSQSATAFTHIINRDVNERYVVVYDDAHSSTDPNGLSDANRQMSAWNLTGGGASRVTVAHSDTDSSVDGVTSFERVTFSAAGTESLDITGFNTATGGAQYTFSVWVRLKTDTTLTSASQLFIDGARVVSTVTTSLADLAYNVWTKKEVTCTIIGSPTSETLRCAVRGVSCTLDMQWPQFELGSSSSLTVAKEGDKPKLKVFDLLTGTERQVFAPHGDAYLTPVNNETKDLRALTVADYTFLVNKEQAVAAGSTTSGAEEYSALIAIGTVQPGSTVKIIINGSTAASQVVSDTDPSELETNWMASQLKAALVTNGYNTSPWSCSLTETEGSVIYIKNTSADFDISVRDGSNGLGIKVIKRKVQYFEDLPRQGKNGFKVEVAGDPVTGFGNYWVEFEGDENGIPVWKESMKFGITKDLDASTMPMKLVRNSSGTFTLAQIDWTQRRVGDDDNNPMPSFVGEKINDIFFTEGRLAFLSAENVIMSEAGEFFNFFRSTVTTLVDGDVIDVGTNHTKVSILRHAVPYQEQLLLFSDQTQFRLTKGDILSPSSVGIEPITEFESSVQAKPAAVGNFVFFAVEKSDYASIREYFVADDSQRNDARDVTGHIPQYIPSGVSELTGSSNEDILFVATDGDTSKLFVYKYFWAANEKVQSSWSEWTWPDVTAILGKHFIQSDLYLVLKRADGVFVEKIEMDLGAQDASGTGYSLSVDRKIDTTQTSKVTASYNSGTDQTTYTFSEITWKSVPKVIGFSGNTTYPDGYDVPIVGNPTTYNSNTIVLDGDTTGEDFLFGIPFTSSYELSDIVVKQSTARGSEVPVGEGRLQVQWITFVFASTGYLKVTVDALGRAANYYEYTGLSLSSNKYITGTLPVDDGKLRVPVQSRNDRVTITISSSSIMPMQIISADWIGNFISRIRSR